MCDKIKILGIADRLIVMAKGGGEYAGLLIIHIGPYHNGGILNLFTLAHIGLRAGRQGGGSVEYLALNVVVEFVAVAGPAFHPLQNGAFRAVELDGDRLLGAVAAAG